MLFRKEKKEKKRLREENEEEKKRLIKYEELMKRVSDDLAEQSLKRKRTSDSKESTASSASFKSDRSKDELIDFKGLFSPRRFVDVFDNSWLDQRTSWSPSVSIFSSFSQKQQDADGWDSTSDSKESTASSASFKSDRSKDELIDFKGQLSPRIRKENRKEFWRSQGTVSLGAKIPTHFVSFPQTNSWSTHRFDYSNHSKIAKKEIEELWLKMMGVSDDLAEQSLKRKRSDSSSSSQEEKEDVAADDGDSDSGSSDHSHDRQINF